MHLMFQQYDERLTRRRATPSTHRNFARTAALFEESGLDPLTAEEWQIEEWLAGLQSPAPRETADEGTGRRALSQRTVRLHAENLNAAYNYAVTRRLRESNPMQGIRLPAEPDKEPRILENGQLRHILGNAVSDQQHLMAHLFIYGGFRLSEVRLLENEDITPTSIRVKRGKGSKLRHVPIHPALSEAICSVAPKGRFVLHAWDPDKPLSEGAMDSRLRKLRGDVFCTFHDFRRTVATNLAEAEVSPLVIDKIMGWSPRTVGSRYYIRTADRSMQEAILRLYADDPLTTGSR